MPLVKEDLTPILNTLLTRAAIRINSRNLQIEVLPHNKPDSYTMHRLVYIFTV